MENKAPVNWYQNIKTGKKNKHDKIVWRADFLAINILFELTTKSAELNSNEMEVSYGYFEKLFVAPKSDVKTSMRLLAQLHLISLQFRTVNRSYGGEWNFTYKESNVLFVTLNPERIKAASESSGDIIHSVQNAAARPPSVDINLKGIINSPTSEDAYLMVVSKTNKGNFAGMGIGDKTCEWCGVNTLVLHKHHFPLEKSHGGIETVKICPNCHSEFHIIKSKNIPC